MRTHHCGVGLLALLLTGCAGGAPQATPTPTPIPSEAALIATLTRVIRSTQPTAVVECPTAGEAVRCSMTSTTPDGRAETSAVYVSVLDDEGHFVYESETEFTPEDYPSSERSCKVLSQPPAGQAGRTGLDYTELLYFWIAAGRPSSMDDDGNGVPCETVYSAQIVSRTMSSPLRFEPYPLGAVSLEDVRAYAEAVLNGDGRPQTQGTLICESSDLDRPAVRGSTLLCRRDTDVVHQEGGIGLTVLDGAGQFAITYFECCAGGPWPQDFPGDATCAVLRAPAVGFEVGFDYGQTLYWWASHGMPAAIDADGDGLPCEDAYPVHDVNTLQPPGS